jgi:hypothetical protein
LKSKEYSFRTKKSGLIKEPFRFKIGKKIWNKTSTKNIYMFAEFEDLQSIANVISLNKKGIILPGFKCNIAGSNTFVQIRKSVKK